MRVATLVLVMVVGTAHADDLADRRKQAQGLSEDAFRKIQDANDYAGAIDLFAKAYDLTKDPAYLLNVAIAARKANLPHQAIATYHRYLEVVGTSIAPELRDQIAAEIAVITRAAATIVVSTEGAAANIELDRRPVGIASKAAPLSVLAATEGGLVHALRATRDGQLDATRDLGTLEPGSTLAIVLEPKLKPTTARITIRSAPGNAQLTNGASGPSLGLAPQTVELVAGDYEIIARLAGRKDGRERIHVVAGDDQDVMVRLDALPTWWARYRTGMYIGGAVTVIIVGALLAPTIREQFQPDGVIRKYP